MRILWPIAAALLTTAGCSTPEEEIVASYDGIGADEVISLGGTEPFWGITIEGETLTYTAPENLDGSTGEVERFAGNGGLSFSGVLEDKAITVMVTPGECSDGMSDASYPFTTTVQWGERALQGCGHTDKQGFTPGEND